MKTSVLFRRIDGSWRAENGQHVELQYSWQDDWRALLPEESPFICSMTVARRLIANLMNGSELLGGGADPFYVFSAEKRRVRVHGTPSEV
jgi:hypothetical protein